MATAKLTLFAMAKYMQDHNNDLFSGFSNLPSNVTKDTLVESILLQGGEFEVMYPDPYFLKDRITYWVLKHKWTFDKWSDLIQIDYEPLYNYDRYEKWTDINRDSRTGTKSETARNIGMDVDYSGSTEEHGDYVDTNGATISHDERATDRSTKDNSITNSQGDNDTTVTNTVSAFNSANYEPSDKSVTNADTSSITALSGEGKENLAEDSTHTDRSASGTTTDGGSFTEGATDTVSNHINTVDGTDTTNGISDGQHDGHMYGNIGVMSSQQMFMMEAEVDRFNIYQLITDMFLAEFVVPVYV